MNILSTDSFKECVFPELAAAIRAREGDVLSRWLTAVREALPSADELTFTQLKDDVPNILDRLAEAMENDSGSSVEEFLSVSTAHGTVRFHQSYNLNELFIEFDLLRRVLLEEVSTHMSRQITVQEMIVLNMGLDIASRRSALAFVNHRTRELQSSAEAQSKYLSFLSHDLRGSLNGLLLMVEVLRRELKPHTQFTQSLEDLDMMKRSIHDTVGTMDRFLHAERFRKGKVQVRPGPLVLRAVINEVANQFSYLAKDTGVTFDVDVPVDCVIVSDRAMINLILQNLISNAIKFSKGGAVTVKAEPMAEANRSYTHITVRDSGPGIAPEKLKTLFTPFTRGETHGQQGVGLGLSIARQAADLLGAKLWVESKLGDGSTFHLELPESIPESKQSPNEAE